MHALLLLIATALGVALARPAANPATTPATTPAPELINFDAKAKPATPVVEVMNNGTCSINGPAGVAFTSLSLQGSGGKADAFCTSLLSLTKVIDTVYTATTYTKTVVRYTSTVTLGNPTATSTYRTRVFTCTTGDHNAAAVAKNVVPTVTLPVATPAILSGLGSTVTEVCKCLDLPVPTATITLPGSKRVVVLSTLKVNKTHINGTPTTTITKTSTQTIYRCSNRSKRTVFGDGSPEATH